MALGADCPDLEFCLDLLEIADQYLVDALERLCENTVLKGITVRPTLSHTSNNIRRSPLASGQTPFVRGCLTEYLVSLSLLFFFGIFVPCFFARARRLLTIMEILNTGGYLVRAPHGHGLQAGKDLPVLLVWPNISCRISSSCSSLGVGYLKLPISSIIFLLDAFRVFTRRRLRRRRFPGQQACNACELLPVCLIWSSTSSRSSSPLCSVVRFGCYVPYFRARLRLRRRRRRRRRLRRFDW